MQKHASRERIFFTFVIAAILVVAGQAAKFAYENHKLTQWLKKEEIYMFRGSYSFYVPVAGASVIGADYMICEPVNDKVQLVEKLEKLMEEKQIIKKAKDYYQEELGEKYGYSNLRILIDFYKPSREFPIGWQPAKDYDMLDYQGTLDNLLISINIPWDAEAEDEHTYYFRRQDNRLKIMNIDAYKQQIQEDGSFVLVPKD